MKPTTSYRTWPTKKLSQKKCVKGSQRIITPKGRPDVRILICCPPGQMSKNKKCKVGLLAHREYKKCGFKKKGKCARAK